MLKLIRKCIPRKLKNDTTLAAAVFVSLCLIICLLIFYSGYILFDDTNKDQNLDWNEIKGFKFRKITSNISTWWNYALGAILGIYALAIAVAVEKKSKKEDLNKQ